MIELMFLITALALGFKHSYDADHLIAVSNLLTKTKSLKNSVKMAFSWSLGHMITASAITIILYIFRDSILKTILANFEVLVAIMLIGIGVWSIYQSRTIHAHKHAHDCIDKSHGHLHMHLKSKETDHIHRHMFGIGIVHGLASNDEILLLLTLSLGVTSLTGMLLGIAVFSLGVVIGMILFALFFNYPLIKANSERLQRIVSLGTGALSVIYGFGIIARIF